MILVDHLSKYLAMRLTLDLDTELPDAYRLINFCIYIAPQPLQLVVLSGNQSLQQVNEKFWKVITIDFRLLHQIYNICNFSLKVNKPLEMYYSWKKS